MGNLNENARNQLKSRIGEIECDLIRCLIEDDQWLNHKQSTTLRWALSLARLSKIQIQKNNPHLDITLGHVSDRYRAELFALLSLGISPMGRPLKQKLLEVIPLIQKIAQKERRDLLSIFSQNMSCEQLDNATRTRPLVLALGGGGGCSYVFMGAFKALEEHNIIPAAITGSSMGAIIGAYRAREKNFCLDKVHRLIEKTPFQKIVQPFSGSSRFGLPATFRLYLRDVVGHEFERGGHFLRLSDLAIPFRVCVAGLHSGTAPKDDELDYYAHLLDQNKTNFTMLSQQKKSIIKVITDFAQQPVKPVYLGSSKLTKEFDVLDAIGFSAAIPGILHYDIMRNDPRMINLVTKLFEQEKIFRLIDGGFVDNLPASQAKQIVDDGECSGYDPLILAFDSFLPGLNRHILFYPIMRFAQENSRAGHEIAHLSINFKSVLSPISLLPTKENFDFAIKNGYAEFSPHISFIRKIIGPIPNPSWI